MKIQASAEGSSREIMIESMLTGRAMGASVPGTINAYTSYDGQVAETYNKYNSFSSFGSQQTRAVVDLRTAFISGEGISISCEDDRTADWIEDFISKNGLDGKQFINAVKGSEMAGQSLLLLRPRPWTDGSVYIRVSRMPYINTAPYRAVYKDPMLREEVQDIQIKQDGQWVSLGFSNFIYVRTGGDDANTSGPVTKVGVALTDIENYDRAIKDMRRNNHVFARITPTFKTETDDEAKALQTYLDQMKWTIGKAFIGSAEMDYATPSGGAHENLETELKATIKTISSVTGIPVHWLGFVDLMSNRSTATSLYELIKNGTLSERVEWEAALKNTILKSQELYINAGGTELPGMNPDFQVRLPLVDFEGFAERIKAWSLAYADQAASIDDYRNAIPGIDPMKTKKAIEEEKKNAEKEMVRMAAELPDETEEDEEDE